MNTSAKNNHARNLRYARPFGERGATLIVALMFLVVMTMVVIAGSQTAVMEERMSGFARDRALAYDSLNNLMDGYLEVSVLPNLNVDAIGTGCYYYQSTLPSYRTFSWATATSGICSDPNTGTASDTQTSNGSQSAVTAPRYMIAWKGSVKFPGANGGYADVWEVTAYGFGMNPGTYVLQSQDNVENN